jgi:hypothetical protein
MMKLKATVAFAVFFLLATANAQTEIHKCTDADGNVAYSQLPCVPQKITEPEKTESEANTELSTPVTAVQELHTSEMSQEEPEQEIDRSACKKRYRDAIDVIDAEIGREYSSDKAAQYKQRLLLLTRKLRQC